jgi:hypothetical protein
MGTLCIKLKYTEDRYKKSAGIEGSLGNTPVEEIRSGETCEERFNL